MALFKDSKDYFKEGEAYFNQGNYSAAHKNFMKAFENGDMLSIARIFEIYKRTGRTGEGTIFVDNLIDSDKISIENKIEICRVMTSNFGLNNKYVERAAELGDFSAVIDLYQKAINEQKEEKVYQYGEIILRNNTADSRLKFNVYRNYAKFASGIYSLDANGFYGFYNGPWHQYTCSSILETIVNTEEFPENIKGVFILELARMYLIQSYCEMKDRFGNDVYYEVYNIKPHGDVVDLLHRIESNSRLRRFYIALLETFDFKDNKKPNYEKAFEILSELSNKDSLDSASLSEPGLSTFKKIFEYGSITTFLNYVITKRKYKKDDAFENIIGNTDFKEKANSLLKILDLQYNQWERTSAFFNFSGFSKNKLLDKNLWLFDGEDGTAKETCAVAFTKRLSDKLITNFVFRPIDSLYLNSIAFDDGKFNYLNNLFKDLKFGELCVLYFDSPYTISRSNNGFDAATAIQILYKKINEFKNNTIILILSGEGDTIKNLLSSIDVYERNYTDVHFHGYTGEEAVQLLNKINMEGNISSFAVEFSDELLGKIKKLIEIKNSSSNRRITFNDIRYIYRMLRDKYYLSRAVSKRTGPYSIDECGDLFTLIENGLGIQKKEDNDFNKIMEDLDRMTGLKNIKYKMRSIISSIKINQLRKLKGLKELENSVHMVFSGNPGTGKTTVAKMMGKILKELNVLSHGHVVEVSRADLVGEYIGQTSTKTRKVLQKALGGVLFIDEAYSLTNKNKGNSVQDYGFEAIEEILKFMSDHKTEICVIVAGYDKEMHDFIDANPGLQSRFNTWITFEDYDEDELYDIFTKLCDEYGFIIGEGVREFIVKDFKTAKSQGNNFGNARYVNTYFNELVSKLGDSLTQKFSFSSSIEPTTEEMQTFTKDLFVQRNTFFDDIKIKDLFF